MGTDIIKLYKKLGSEVKLHIVQKLLETLSSSGKILHDAINKQIYIETLLLKAMRLSRARRIEDLLERINMLRASGKLSDLEKKIPSFAEKKKINEEKAIYDENQPIIEDDKTESLKVQNDKVVYEADNTPKKEGKSVSDNNSDYLKESLTEKKTEKKTETPPIAEPVHEIEERPVIVAVEKKAVESKVDDLSPKSTPHTAKAETKKIILPDTPEKLWHKLIMDMDHVSQPQLKFYLQEAKPKSINNNSITVLYDEEFGTVPAHRV